MGVSFFVSNLALSAKQSITPVISLAAKGWGTRGGGIKTTPSVNVN